MNIQLIKPIAAGVRNKGKEIGIVDKLVTFTKPLIAELDIKEGQTLYIGNDGGNLFCAFVSVKDNQQGCVIKRTNPQDSEKESSLFANNRWLTKEEDFGYFEVDIENAVEENGMTFYPMNKVRNVTRRGTAE